MPKRPATSVPQAAREHVSTLTAFVQPRFGQLLAACRRTRGVTQEEAAAEANISQTTFSRVERGDDVHLSVAVQLTVWAVTRGRLAEVSEGLPLPAQES